MSRAACRTICSTGIRHIVQGGPVQTLVLSSFGFDLTQKNLLVPLIDGGSVHLPVAPYYDGEAICDQIAGGWITVINCTPSAILPGLDLGGDAAVPRLEHCGRSCSAASRLPLAGCSLAAVQHCDAR